jgi:hypothetical protein
MKAVLAKISIANECTTDVDTVKMNAHGRRALNEMPCALFVRDQFDAHVLSVRNEKVK